MITLSTREREILAELKFQADISLLPQPRVFSQSAEAVRGCLARCMEHRAVLIAPIKNVYPLGFTRFGVFFSLTPEARLARPRIAEAIYALRPVVWSAEMGGQFDYCMTLVARDVGEVLDVFGHFCSTLGNVIRAKSVVTQRRVTLFPDKFLGTKRAPVPNIWWGPTGSRVTLQSLDHEILQCIALESTISRRDICQRLGVTSQELDTRLERLRREQVFRGCALVLDPIQFGRQCYFFMVHTRSTSAEQRARLFTLCEQHPDIVRLIETFGEWDYQIGAYVEQPEDAARLSDEIVRAVGQSVSHVEVVPQYRIMKVAFYPFDAFDHASGVPLCREERSAPPERAVGCRE